MPMATLDHVMSNKATHNGTCQVCGRQQARRPNGLAQHGYTVDYGYFQGVCHGSANLPIEESTLLLDSTVATLRANAMRLRTAQTPETVTTLGPVAATYRSTPWARDVEHVHFDSEATFKRRMIDEPNVRKHLARSYYCHGDDAALWLAIAEREAYGHKLRANALEGHAAALAHLKETRHGQPLTPREARA